MNSSRFESLTGEVDLDFPEYDDPPAEPMALVHQWITEATAREVREPRALALATADSRGRASNRIVSVTDITARGLVFASHSTSQKGREMTATGWASGLLYWRETGQQLVLSGPVAQLSDADSDALWSGRPIPMHSMSAASRQSEPLRDVAALRAEADRLAAPGAPLPRPARFVGYLLAPVAVEFWCADSDRLHRRLRYDRHDHGWHTSHLQP
ncbi:phenazine biosynthesis FMN-dependent oxidase PhzG [Streptomyces lomondensis]|uniref:FMN-dependent oxidase n=1 Tax=Streptomyces lomondensis TaxID=68229 RepID=A0A0E3Z871_9ACTN|nr:phenazine biosynthesis FMN-dependent oxidase PhzG [Streptomyces lomondensis]AKC91617.1 FMN-dependent oxidase [Streptomyces lomondensis]MCF0079938.1 phenazine biosynthesis FMN-dependent oxidase PhzG [Streptomyces lomondensis]GGW97303.1 pyridoxamine 5'-phosphate oxidase [Streptomyces lomondensis]